MIAVYDKLIYFNEASKYTILRMRTDDPSVPEEARSQYTFRDRMLRFTAVGYGLPQTDSVKLEIEGDWKEGKYSLQLHVEHWHELVPPTTEGLLSYLSSGLLKGIGESTARSIVQRFGTDTLDVLEYHPEKLLEIRGITEQKLEEIKTCYAESRAMRDIMELLTPFQVTPVTAMKIYQHFGPACTDILRKSPFRLCEISGFGFRRVDTIIRKSGGDPHDPIRIHGAMICALENARQHGHLYLEVNTLIAESLQFLNEPIPLPQMQVRRAEVEQKLQQMAEDNEIVSDGGRLYLPHIFMQEVETAAKAAAMLMESTAKIDVTLPLEQVKQKLGLHLTKRQSRGVEVAMERNLSIITGGPGTGKTTVLKAIIEVYAALQLRNYSIRLHRCENDFWTDRYSGSFQWVYCKDPICAEHQARQQQAAGSILYGSNLGREFRAHSRLCRGRDGYIPDQPGLLRMDLCECVRLQTKRFAANAAFVGNQGGNGVIALRRGNKSSQNRTDCAAAAANGDRPEIRWESGHQHCCCEYR